MERLKSLKDPERWLYCCPCPLLPFPLFWRPTHIHTQEGPSPCSSSAFPHAFLHALTVTVIKQGADTYAFCSRTAPWVSLSYIRISNFRKTLTHGRCTHIQYLIYIPSFIHSFLPAQYNTTRYSWAQCSRERTPILHSTYSTATHSTVPHSTVLDCVEWIEIIFLRLQTRPDPSHQTLLQHLQGQQTALQSRAVQSRVS